MVINERKIIGTCVDVSFTSNDIRCKSDFRFEFCLCEGNSFASRNSTDVID